MAQPTMQTSFHAGEWAPALNARVDLAKYRAGAELMRNFFVDYRGGASTRMGTKYILQAYKSATEVRLIPFQASFTVSYMLEFGDLYIRFFTNGAPVLEAAGAIVAATQGVSCTLQVNSHGYQVGEWVFVSGVSGMTELNGRYFIVTNVPNPNTFIIADLFGNTIDSTGFGAYTSGGTTQRIYTLPSPYSASELALIKYAQNVNFMVLCHPNHSPYTLTFNSSANWELTPIVFGTTVATPTSLSISTSSAGNKHFSYKVSAVDENAQESTASTEMDITVNPGATNQTAVTFSWGAVTGATSYNIYRAGWNEGAAMPSGSAFGLVANITGTSFIDNFVSVTSSNPADYSLTPIIPKNPFIGAGVASVAVTAPGTYTISPAVTFSPPPSGGIATGIAYLGVQTIALTGSSSGWSVGDIARDDQYGVTLVVSVVNGFGQCVNFEALSSPGSNRGSVYSTTALDTTLNFEKIVGGVPTGPTCSITVTWGVVSVLVLNRGSGYLVAPTVTFASGAATATATLETADTGNPTVPIFFQQRLVLAGPTNSPQRFNISQPGNYYNFNESDPIQPDDAIEGFLVSGQLNTIKGMIQLSKGLLLLSDKQAWLISAPSGGGVSPIDIAADGQAYNGSSDLQPIVVNYDVLYVQSKGSIVRDLTFNFYTNIYTGADITVLSSHLFYGFTVVSWAYAEEPFKVLWAVRNDGTLLSLTFLKEQELVGWAHSDTNGLFKSVGTIVESTATGVVDALYCVVERTINSQTVKYIERMAERSLTGGAEDAWCVDAGLQYSGAPTTSFSGAEHLVGMTVTGLADGLVIPPFTMASTGTFTLASAASKVTVGLAFTPQFKTLALDLGEPTVQGKRKKITGVTLRCQDTLGLSIGRSFSSLVPMKDLVLGNIGSMSNEVVSDLVTGDARTNIDPLWDVPGQYCIQQDNPWPATILGVIPEINVGDAPR